MENTTNFFEARNITPIELKKELSDLFDGYMQNENNEGNFKFDSISRKFYVLNVLNELLDHQESIKIEQ